MEINDADAAELVDARDLKFSATARNTRLSCKTTSRAPADLTANPRDLQNAFAAADRDNGDCISLYPIFIELADGIFLNGRYSAPRPFPSPDYSQVHAALVSDWFR